MPIAPRTRPQLEIALLRRGVGDLAAARCRCHACRRTPLPGERVAEYDDGRTLCALCRGRRREPPASTRVVGLRPAA
jgi:hypothetical protein